MTLTELKSLTGSQLRILVAEAEGWTKLPFSNDCWQAPSNGTIYSPGFDKIPQFEKSRDDIVGAILRRFNSLPATGRLIDCLIEIIAPGEQLESLTRAGAFCIATASAEDLCRAYIAALKGEE